MKKLFIRLVLLLVLGVGARGQAVNPPGQDKGAKDDDKGAALAAERDAVDLARQRGRKGDAAGVEEVVTVINVSPKNTADWYLETAQRLMQTAESLAREGQGAQVTALAQRAIQNLAFAEAKTKEPGLKAAARNLAGFIQERYLADTTAARASYEGAAQLAPNEAKGAKEAAERLKKTEDNRKDKTPDKLKEKIDPVRGGDGGHG